MTQIVIGKSEGKNLALNLDALLRGRMLVQANSGKGKSWLLRRLAEQLFGKVQVIIIDPEGEFATLREKFGYVLVGKGGETPADPRSAALIAHKLLELRASAVCDLYEMKPASRHEFVQKFLDAMIDAPKNLWHPCILMVDEAHVYCPEKGAGESLASESMIGLATRGRKRGFACILATQRLGKLRKDAAAELLNVLIGGTFIDVDRKRAADALGVYGHDQKKFFDEIKVLERGKFFALGPALSLDRVLVEIGPVETTHPEAGSSRHAAEPPPAPDKIRAMLPKLADLPKAAEEKAKTENELRAEIRSLKAQIRSAPVQKVQPMAAKVDQRAIERAIRKAEDSIIAQAKMAIGAREAAVTRLVKSFSAFEPERTKDSGVEIQKGEKLSGLPGFALERDTMPVTQAHPRPMLPKVDSSREINLKAGARRMLTILAQWHPEAKTRDELGALAGFAASGGTFSDYLSKLRLAGFIHENGNGICATDDGLAAVGNIPDLPQGPAALVAMWKSKFKAGIGKMLDVLVAQYPTAITRQQLGEQSGFASSGGTFSDYLSQLRRARLIEEPGGNVKASDSLF